ncbi:MAG: DUF2971 domain-containing protein [Bacteroidota bacterium]|nr:DUF2971 domain-containing protein [Bacteroidota bacterium]
MALKIIDTVFGKKEIDMINHAAFGEIPKTVYKYRDWRDDYHKRILTHNEVYLSSPEEFNDPFDCGIEIAYDLLQKDERLRFEYFSTFVSRARKDLTPLQQSAEVEKLIAEKRYENNKWLEYVHNQSLLELNKRFGFFCVTPVPDNILMWSHYSNSHKGFCVGFDSVKLFSLINGRGGQVFYRDNYPLISPLLHPIEQSMHQTNSKAHFWNYEIEYRLMKHIKEGRILTLPPDVIRSVILGCSIPPQHKDEIVKTLKESQPNVMLYQASVKRRTYELDMVEL